MANTPPSPSSSTTNTTTTNTTNTNTSTDSPPPKSTRSLKASKSSKPPHIALTTLYFDSTPPPSWNVNDFVKHCRGKFQSGKLRGIGAIHNYWWNTVKNIANEGDKEERRRANEILAARKRKPDKDKSHEPKTPPKKPVDPDRPAPSVSLSPHADTELDEEFNHVRSKFPSAELPDLLYQSIIDVSDPLSLKLFRNRRITSHLHFPPLPPAPEHFDYAINRFLQAPLSQFRELVESPPRPPGVPYSPETHVATYVHHCMQTILCTPRGWAHTPHREGTLDVMVWGPFLDFLFLATPHLVFTRKEISALLCTTRDRFDGVLRFDDRLVAFDVGIHECSVEAVNISNDPKREADFIKMVAGMADMLRGLARLVDLKWEVMEGLEVVGFLTTGWNVECFRMAFVTPRVFRLGRERVRRLVWELEGEAGPGSGAGAAGKNRGVVGVAGVMRVLVQYKVIVEKTMAVVRGYIEGKS